MTKSGDEPLSTIGTKPAEQLDQRLAALGAETRVERSVKRIVPWVVSFVLHVGVGLLALFITWTVANRPKDDDAVLIVADFDALHYQPVAGFEAPTTPAESPKASEVSAPAPSSQQISAALRPAVGDPLAELVDPGLLSQPLAGGSILEQFTPKAGSNTATFAGARGSNARRIVYCIDASGSMVPYLQTVVAELDRSLQALSPRQQFSVIFFQGTSALEMAPSGTLAPASAEQRLKTLKWIREEIVPAGGTNPLVAIEKALALKPDVIFLLSQNITGYGQFEIDQRDLLELLDRLNPEDAGGRRAVQINCIQFLDPDALDTMRKIAEIHGGANGYKFLTREELGLPPR